MAASDECYGMDVFEDDDNNTDFKVEEHTWRKFEDKYLKDGYRNGIEMGEEQAVQSGHDKGFQQSLSLVHTSSLRGVVSALRCYTSLQEPTESQTEFLQQIDNLHSSIMKLEEDLETDLSKLSNCEELVASLPGGECAERPSHVTAEQCALLDVVCQLSAAANFVDNHHLSIYSSLLGNVRLLVEKMS